MPNILPPAPNPNYHNPINALSDPTPQNINSVGNNLWLSTVYLFGQPPYGLAESATPLNFELAMQGILAFTAQYPVNGPAPTDPYLRGVWEELQNQNPVYGNATLATLAANYAQGGFLTRDFNTFTKMVSDPYSPWAQLVGTPAQPVGTIQLWGQEEGGYNPNPQNLIQSDFNQLLTSLTAYPQNPTNILNAVKALTNDLSTSKSPLDGVSQFLQNLLNTPLDPTNSDPNLAKDTLASLSANGDSSDLQALIYATPGFFNPSGGVLITLLNQLSSMEW